MMRTPSTKTVLFAALVAVAALPLTACVAPGYGPYGGQSGFPGQQYGTPAYSQPAYSQPGYVSQPAYQGNPAPAYPYDTQNGGQYGSQYGNPSGSAYGTQYGTITNIRPISNATGPSGIAGTVVGALIGGVLTTKVGS